MITSLQLLRHNWDEYGGRKTDHGNVVAEEGCTRCVCGCKYWENDKCIDCGRTPERVWIEQHANNVRLGNEVWLNTLVTTSVVYKYGWTDHVPAVGDLTDILSKYRAMGTID